MDGGRFGAQRLLGEERECEFGCEKKLDTNSRLSHSLLNDMLKRISCILSNAIEILYPNNLEDGDGEEEVFEGSESDSAAVDTAAIGGDDFMHTDDFRRLFVGSLCLIP